MVYPAQRTLYKQRVRWPIPTWHATFAQMWLLRETLLPTGMNFTFPLFLYLSHFQVSWSTVHRVQSGIVDDSFGDGSWVAGVGSTTWKSCRGWINHVWRFYSNLISLGECSNWGWQRRWGRFARNCTASDQRFVGFENCTVGKITQYSENSIKFSLLPVSVSVNFLQQYPFSKTTSC